MRAFFVLTSLLIRSIAFSQSSTQLLSADGKVIAGIGDINGAVITTLRPNNIEGNPYIGGTWNKGAVLFKKGKKADSLLLQFDLVANKIYFKDGGFTMAFVDEVEAFLLYAAGDSVPDDMLFRKGYPVSGQLGPESFYEVLSDGPKFHLLKYRTVKISEIYVYNQQPRRKYSENAGLHLYNVSSASLQRIKPGKKNVLKLLPSLTEKIELLCKKYKWDLNTEPELAQLVKALNIE